MQPAGMMNSLLSGCCGPHLFQPVLFFFLECDQPTSQRKKKKQESVIELQLAVCFKQIPSGESN